MDARYYIDPSTNESHIYGHAVSEREVEDVLGRPIEDRPGREGSRVAIGQTREDVYKNFEVAKVAPGNT